MLHLIPPPLARLAYRAAHAVRLRYWRWRKPRIHGCTIIARDGGGRLLLIRPSYGGSLWQFPGGGMKAGSDPLAAARREFVEETGLVLAAARSLGAHDRWLAGATNVVHIVVGAAEGAPQVDNREIVAAAWFDRTELPEPRNANVEGYLGMADL